ncbi:MAG TPA: HAD family hydrolase [Eudoraea sp.]|nr:HAD family hydrolase [Eudoraea sp.]
MEYKCIIFDCDGVLVDSEAISTTILVNMANSIGANIEMEGAVDFFAGKSLGSCLAFIESRINRKIPDGFEQTFRKRTFEAFRTDLQPIDGIHSLLEKITIPYCVASSGPVDKIRLNLTTTDLIRKFEGNIFSSYDIGSWKPEPDIFLHAAEQMGFEAGECVVIEDSLAGIIAARTGGFEVFGFANEKNRDIFANEGARVFSDMDTLGRYLLNNRH